MTQTSNGHHMNGGDSQAPIVFSEEVLEDGERYVIEIPPSLEGDTGVHPDETYRIALISDASELIRRAGQGDSKEATRAPNTSEPTASRTAPVSTDETLSVTITADGTHGDGVAKVNGGFVIFVPEASVGEEVLVRVTDVKGTYAQAEIIKHL